MKRRPNHIQKLIKQIKSKSSQQNASKHIKQPFSVDLRENEKAIKEWLGSSQDVLMTKFTIKLQTGDKLDAMMVAIDGTVDEAVKREDILKQLQNHPLETLPNHNLDQIQDRLSAKHIVTETDMPKAINHILKSHILLIINGYNKGLLITADGFEIRSITEPETERLVRGPREGFIESIGVNLSLIRRRIRHPSLRFETMSVGEYSETDITVAYVKDIADPEIVDRVKKRIQAIKIDTINHSGDIEQLIEDHPYSIFPTIGNTERPDKASAMLMEGRVIILVNGDPVVLVTPFLFVESFMNIEDYSSRPFYSSFIRLLRFASFLISIILPALYIAALNFNKALIPSDLIVPLIQARETVPFPLSMEIILTIVIFEAVREAGVRLPQQIGTAVTIVGPLILGEVAVSAGLIGPPTIIIVSLSYIASFIISPIADVTALVRLYLFTVASILGSFGMSLALLGLLTHMVYLTSFGVPYMSPFSPIQFSDLKDTLIRIPTRLIKTRPKSIPKQRYKRIHSVPDTGDKK